MWVETKDKRHKMINSTLCTGLSEGSDCSIIFCFQGSGENINAYYKSDEIRDVELIRIKDLLLGKQSASINSSEG